mgnify:FL=1
MENVRKIGYYCVALVFIFEIGGVLVNIRNGQSAFYLFDFAERFSLENGLFLVYWGYLVGCFFIIKDVFFDGKSLDDVFNSLSWSTNHLTTKKEGDHESVKLKPRDLAVQREREFIKKSVSEHKAKNPVVKVEKVKKDSIEYKLKNLRNLYDKELISKEVYEKRQQQILSESKWP